MTVALRADAPAGDILYVMQHLRDLDRIEASATSWSDEPVEWAAITIAGGRFQWVAYLDEVPVAVLGAAPTWPGNWFAWCLGTADFPHVALTLSRHVKNFMLPALLNAGMLRMTAYAYADYEGAHRWLAFLGGKPEATLENWGKNGETFVSYVWLREAPKPMERTAMAHDAEASAWASSTPSRR